MGGQAEIGDREKIAEAKRRDLKEARDRKREEVKRANREARDRERQRGDG